MGLCHLKRDIHRYLLSTGLFFRHIWGLKKLKSKNKQFVSRLFFMYFHSFSIFTVQNNEDRENFDNTFESLLSLILKWRTFNIIKVLIWVISPSHSKNMLVLVKIAILQALSFYQNSCASNLGVQALRF